MRIWFFIWIIINLLPPALRAQERLLLSDTDTIHFAIRNPAGIPKLDWARPAPDGNGPGLAGIQWLELNDAGLVLSYQLPPLNARETGSGFYYELAIGLIGEDGSLAWKGDAVRVDRSFNHLRWAWPDALEKGLDFNRSYRLLISTGLRGNLERLELDCSQEGAFPAGSLAPNIALGGAGLGMLGAGLAYRVSADKNYEDYRQRWSGGHPPAEAEPYYDQAKKEARISGALTWAGLAVMGIDAAWYSIRMKKHRSNEQLRRKYCQGPPPAPQGKNGLRQQEIRLNGLGLSMRF